MQTANITEAELNAFIANNSARKGSAVFNMKTKTCSAEARKILATSKYPKLAKQSIPTALIRAFNMNAAYKQKLADILEELHIQLVE